MFSDSDRPDSGAAGFTLIEVLIATLVISVAFMALITVSIPIIKGNKISRGETQAAAKGQSVLEDLKNRMFYLGQDGVLGVSATGRDDWGPDGEWDNKWDDTTSLDGTPRDDLISARLRDPDCLNPTYPGNVCEGADDTNISQLSTPAQIAAAFASPDWDIDGSMNPTITITREPQVVWNIRDNAPLDGLKRILVIVGWQEGDANRYVVMSTFVAGWRHENEPYTK